MASFGCLDPPGRSLSSSPWPAISVSTAASELHEPPLLPRHQSPPRSARLAAALAESPQAPPPSSSSRPQSVRGPGRRYLQQTLHKLGEDSLRIGRRLQGEAAWSQQPLPPVRQAAALTPEPKQTDPWEHTRQLVAELPGKPPAEWHSETAARCPDELTVHDEADAGLLLDASNPNMPSALLAVAKVINSWEADVRAAADVWRVGLSEQVGMRAQADERWAALQERLEQLQDRIEQVDSNVRVHRTSAGELQEKLEAQIESSLQEVAQGHSRQIEGAVDSLTRSVVGEGDALKRHVDMLLAGTLETTTGGQKTLGAQVNFITEELTGLAKREEFLTETADKWQRSCEEAQSEVRRLKGDGQVAREQAQQLNDSIADLEEQLQKVQQALEKAQDAPGSDTLRKLMEVEERGNVRIDRQTGRLDMVRPIDFTPCNPADPGPPSVDFQDTLIASAVLADITEIAGMFKVPVQVDVQLLPGKGGKPEFWESIAGAQARFFSQQLGKRGVPQHLLSSHGSLPPKGAKAGQIWVQLSQEIFPPHVLAGKGIHGERGASKPSPRRK